MKKCNIQTHKTSKITQVFIHFWCIHVFCKSELHAKLQCCAVNSTDKEQVTFSKWLFKYIEHPVMITEYLNKDFISSSFTSNYESGWKEAGCVEGWNKTIKEGRGTGTGNCFCCSSHIAFQCVYICGLCGLYRIKADMWFSYMLVYCNVSTVFKLYNIFSLL